jgi:hypothetical protein
VVPTTTLHPLITMTPVITTVAPLFALNDTPTITTPIPREFAPGDQGCDPGCRSCEECLSYTELVEFLQEKGWEWDDPSTIAKECSCGYSEQYREERYCYIVYTCGETVTLETTRPLVEASITEHPEPPSTPGPFQADHTPVSVDTSVTTRASLSGGLVILALALIVALAYRNK